MGTRRLKDWRKLLHEVVMTTQAAIRDTAFVIALRRFWPRTEDHGGGVHGAGCCEAK